MVSLPSVQLPHFGRDTKVCQPKHRYSELHSPSLSDLSLIGRSVISVLVLELTDVQIPEFVAAFGHVCGIGEDNQLLMARG